MGYQSCNFESITICILQKVIFTAYWNSGIEAQIYEMDLDYFALLEQTLKYV